MAEYNAIVSLCTIQHSTSVVNGGCPVVRPPWWQSSRGGKIGKKIDVLNEKNVMLYAQQIIKY
jgi:hypothetical protein